VLDDADLRFCIRWARGPPRGTINLRGTHPVGTVGACSNSRLAVPCERTALGWLVGGVAVLAGFTALALVADLVLLAGFAALALVADLVLLAGFAALALVAD
jgi:hypothetical protein